MNVIPVFYDLEINRDFNKNEVPPSITELSAYIPTRKGEDSWFNRFLKPEEQYQLKKMKKDKVKRQTFTKVWPEFLKWVKKDQQIKDTVVLISHNNYNHDKPILDAECRRADTKIPRDWKFFCTLWLSNMLFGFHSGNSLQSLRERYSIEYIGAHKAEKDVKILYQIFKEMTKGVDRNEIYSKMVLQHPIKTVASALKAHFVARPIFLDLEATGLFKEGEPGPYITEIAAYTPEREGKDAIFQSLVQPPIPIPEEVIKITGITNDDVSDAEPFNSVWERFKYWCTKNIKRNERIVFIAHNAFGYDLPLLKQECERVGKSLLHSRGFDTLWLARCMHRREKRPRGFFKLQNLRKHFGIPENNAHRALDDVIVMVKVFNKWRGKADEQTSYNKMLQSHPIKSVEQFFREQNVNQEKTSLKRNIEHDSQPKEVKRRKRTIHIEEKEDEDPIIIFEEEFIAEKVIAKESESLQASPPKKRRKRRKMCMNGIDPKNIIHRRRYFLRSDSAKRTSYLSDKIV